MVGRLVWDEEVAGSIPVIPTDRDPWFAAGSGLSWSQ